jgi:hypothetical protein
VLFFCSDKPGQQMLFERFKPVEKRMLASTLAKCNSKAGKKEGLTGSMTLSIDSSLVQIIHKFVDQSEQIQYRSGFTECSPPQGG